MSATMTGHMLRRWRYREADMTPKEFEAMGMPWPQPAPGLRAPFIECTSLVCESNDRLVHFIPPAKPGRTYEETDYDDDGEPLDTRTITRTDAELASALAAWEKSKDGVAVVKGPPATVTATFRTEFGSTADGMLVDGVWQWTAWRT